MTSFDRAVRAALCACAILVTTGRAAADPAVRAGLELRTDLRAHPVRLPLSVHLERVDLTLVLDPLVIADGEHDADVTVEWRRRASRTAALFGWRTSALAVAGGIHWQQRSLVGVTTHLGRWRWLDAQFGAEAALLWVRHGAATETTWIGADRAIADHLRFGMFVRVSYAL